MTYSEFLDKTLTLAASIANDKFGKVSGTTKSGDNNQVLTEADLAVGQRIIAEITKHFQLQAIIHDYER
ncbi:MAG TPA: hypothetical protein VG935_00100 [Patescibacteria group bacterium]|nr:hypothetical protein [Patescibacteria group bacterium]